jgi:hypothetical protein
LKILTPEICFKDIMEKLMEVRSWGICGMKINTEKENGGIET